MQLKKLIVLLAIMVWACAALHSLDLPRYSPEPTTFFIHEMTYMLDKSPRFLPFYGTAFWELDSRNFTDHDRPVVDGEVVPPDRFALMGGSILPIPFVSWLSFSINGIFLIDGAVSHGPNPGDFGNDLHERYYGNAGFITDTTYLTAALFGAYEHKIDEQARNGITTEVTEGRFRVAFIPIIKASEISWLRYLDSIANYINYGGKANDTSFGQRYRFSPLYINEQPLTFKLSWGKEAYTSFIKNYIYDIEAAFGSKWFAVLNVGYQDFYEKPKYAVNVNNSFYYKAMAGYDFSRDIAYVDKDGIAKTRKSERMVWARFSHDFQDYGFGLGFKYSIFHLNVEIRPTTDRFQGSSRICLDPLIFR